MKTCTGSTPTKGSIQGTPHCCNPVDVGDDDDDADDDDDDEAGDVDDEEDDAAIKATPLNRQ